MSDERKVSVDDVDGKTVISVEQKAETVGEVAHAVFDSLCASIDTLKANNLKGGNMLFDFWGARINLRFDLIEKEELQ